MADTEEKASQPAPSAKEDEGEGITVLLAIDQSPHAEYAVNYYLSEIHRPNNHVILAHTTEPPRLPASYGAAGPVAMTTNMIDEVIEQKKADLRKLKKHFTHIVQKEKVRSHHVRIVEHSGGNPGHAIVLMAKDEQAELIVMGTRGMGAVRRTILGSVSDYVLHHAHIPIVICHLPEDHPDFKHHHDHGHKHGGAHSGGKK